MKGKNIYNIKIQDSRQRIISSILIPQVYWSLFENQKKRLNKNTNELLPFLLRRFSVKKWLLFSQTNRSTTSYQKTGQNLIKHNFSVTPANWQRMRSLAKLYGISICHFFIVLLLLLETKYVGTPLKFVLSMRLETSESIDFNNFYIFKSYQIKGSRMDTG